MFSFLYGKYLAVCHNRVYVHFYKQLLACFPEWLCHFASPSTGEGFQLTVFVLHFWSSKFPFW